MLKGLLKKLVLAVLLIAGLTTAYPVASTFAASDPSTDVCNLDVPDSVKNANNCNGAKDGASDIIVNIINAVIGLLGIAAVIVIIIGGINYMTSSGETAKIEKAKKTILYAVIGLVIAVLAFAIVNFTIGILGGERQNDTSSEAKDNSKADSKPGTSTKDKTK
ncbi:hypothetical protein J5491_01305 [Candidatus Saccharibacteria bacterium]|nr:hypothetical protein [Candidatus Saccharibacteria bacterium]